DAKAKEGSKASIGSVKTELQDMIAQGGVRVRGKDGAVATGDELQMWMDNAQPQIKLSGAPAKVDDKTNQVIGNLILVHGGEQWYEIAGPGSMHLVQRDEKKATTRPV